MPASSWLGTISDKLGFFFGGGRGAMSTQVTEGNQGVDKSGKRTAGGHGGGTCMGWNRW